MATKKRSTIKSRREQISKPSKRRRRFEKQTDIAQSIGKALQGFKEGIESGGGGAGILKRIAKVAKRGKGAKRALRKSKAEQADIARGEAAKRRAKIRKETGVSFATKRTLDDLKKAQKTLKTTTDRKAKRKALQNIQRNLGSKRAAELGQKSVGKKGGKGAGGKQAGKTPGQERVGRAFKRARPRKSEAQRKKAETESFAKFMEKRQAKSAKRPESAAFKKRAKANAARNLATNRRVGKELAQAEKKAQAAERKTAAFKVKPKQLTIDEAGAIARKKAGIKRPKQGGSTELTAGNRFPFQRAAPPRSTRPLTQAEKAKIKGAKFGGFKSAAEQKKAAANVKALLARRKASAKGDAVERKASNKRINALTKAEGLRVKGLNKRKGKGINTLSSTPKEARNVRKALKARERVKFNKESKALDKAIARANAADTNPRRAANRAKLAKQVAASKRKAKAAAKKKSAQLTPAERRRLEGDPGPTPSTFGLTTRKIARKKRKGPKFE